MQDETSPRTLLVKIALLIGGLVLTNHLVWERLQHFINGELWFALSVFCLIWLASLLAVLYVAFTPHQGTRLFWTIIIGFSTLFHDVYFRSSGNVFALWSVDEWFNRSAKAMDQQLSNPDLANAGLVESASSSLIFSILATAMLVAGLMLRHGAVDWLKPRLLVLLPATPLLLLTALAAYAGVNRGQELHGMPGQFEAAGVMLAYMASPTPSFEKSKPSFEPKQAAVVNHVILIIDESVAGDFIDLNVNRGTTPYLYSRKDQLVTFGLSLSAHNCSEHSNAVLRLGAAPSQLGDSDNLIINNPSIWQYAKRAGFATTLINAQFDPADNDYFMSDQERALIDQWIAGNEDVERYDRDRALLEHVVSVLNRPEPQFLLLIKQGVHTPYITSYPPNHSEFKPEMNTDERIEDRISLVNSYKNAILWNVDEFFEELFTRVSPESFAIIYTSDHGQNLLDDGEPVTHCRRLGQTLEEAIVPMLVWTDSPLLHARFQQAARLNWNASSHFQVFPTLLQLFGYDSQDVKDTYWYSLFEKPPGLPGFASGSILGRFGTKPTWNPAQGMEELQR